jgi:hypothetical protein
VYPSFSTFLILSFFYPVSLGSLTRLTQHRSPQRPLASAIAAQHYRLWNSMITEYGHMIKSHDKMICTFRLAAVRTLKASGIAGIQ